MYKWLSDKSWDIVIRAERLFNQGAISLHQLGQIRVTMYN